MLQTGRVIPRRDYPTTRSLKQAQSERRCIEALPAVYAMSGVEIVGFVLGGFPLLISAAEHYKSGKSWYASL